MNPIISFLIFAAFFYFMMRFGCGAHMVHGGHGGHAGHEAGHGGHGGGQHADERPQMTGTKAVDPVCGMEVEAGHGYAKIHDGKEYRFCSKKCLDRFEEDATRYARA